MKKRMILLTGIIMMMFALTACGKFTCDFCGQESTGRSYKATVLGKEMRVCQECHDGMEELGNLFGGE